MKRRASSSSRARTASSTSRCAVEQLGGAGRARVARARRACPASTPSSSPAGSPTATTCAPAPSPGSRRSWPRSPTSPPRAGRSSGICNGFQVLTEAGLLPGALQKNADLKFLCDTVECRVETHALGAHRRCGSRRRAAPPDQPLRGQLHVRRGDARRLRDDDRIVLRYVDNPNGCSTTSPGSATRPATSSGSCPTPSGRPTRCSDRATASCCSSRCSRRRSAARAVA